MNNKNKITIKDLIMTGIFSAIYFIFSWIVGIPLGLMVITYLAYPFVYAIAGAIISMFFMSKVPKAWLTFVFTFIPGLPFFFMGFPPIFIAYFVLCSIFAELSRRFTGYKSIKGMKLAHVFISLTSLGQFLMIFVAKDLYYKLTVASMGETYANQLLKLPIWILFALFVSIVIGAYLGGNIGEKILRKHLNGNDFE